MTDFRIQLPFDFDDDYDVELDWDRKKELGTYLKELRDWGMLGRMELL